ncbi:hypothetical protein KY345_03405 [Candidatus Woesearchaeota archaeon]|nr:hypothetical protein [Candidatus Woesearchaeota archaeon]
MTYIPPANQSYAAAVTALKQNEVKGDYTKRPYDGFNKIPLMSSVSYNNGKLSKNIGYNLNLGSSATYSKSDNSYRIDSGSLIRQYIDPLQGILSRYSR